MRASILSIDWRKLEGYFDGYIMITYHPSSISYRDGEASSLWYGSILNHTNLEDEPSRVVLFFFSLCSSRLGKFNY